MSSKILTRRTGVYAKSAGSGGALYPKLWRGLVGAWPIGMQSGGDQVHDLSRRGSHLNYGPSGLMTWTAGKYGKAISLNGSTDYARTVLKGMSSINNCTIAIRFMRTETLAAYDCLMVSAPDGLQGLIISGAGGTPLTYMWENTADEWNGATGLTMTQNVWHFGALTVTGTEANVYLDRSSYNNTKTHTTKDLTTFDIGREETEGKYWGGRVNEAYMWNRALSEKELGIVRDQPFAVTMRRITPLFVPTAAASAAGFYYYTLIR